MTTCALLADTTDLDGEDKRSSPFEDDCFMYLHVKDVTAPGERRRVNPILNLELELFTTKWFDYRQMTPLQATRVFMDCFNKIYQRHHAKNFDRARSDYVKPVVLERTFQHLEIRDDEQDSEAILKIKAKRRSRARQVFYGCHRARRAADALGVPYDVYIDLAFQYRLNYWKQYHMPQPTHLYGEMVIDKVQDRWEEMQTGRLYLSEEPVYMVQNYAGYAHQNAYHEWLFKQANLRSNPPMFLAQFVNEDRLPIDKVRSRCDDFTMERVERYLLQ